MANTTYKDDSVVYNFEKDIIYTRGCEFVPNGDLLKVAEEQLKSGEKLNSWIIRDNSDILKSACLYAMLDVELFYDKLSNNDKNRFSSELLRMSKDEVNFDDTNREFFVKFAGNIDNNITNPTEYYDSEEDKKLDELAIEYFNYNKNFQSIYGTGAKKAN